MEHILSQIGLLSIFAVLLFIMWKADLFFYERNASNSTSLFDSDSDEKQD